MLDTYMANLYTWQNLYKKQQQNLVEPLYRTNLEEGIYNDTIQY